MSRAEQGASEPSRTPHPAVREALARVADSLDLPQPERTRILEEIALDLDDIQEGLVGRGLTREAAVDRAIRLLVPSGPAVDALVEMHEPTYRKLRRRFSSRGMKRMEWAFLLAVATTGVVPPAATLVGSGLLTRPSPILWAILAVGALILALVGRKALQLLVVRDHEPGTSTNGLALIPALAGGALALGAFGTLAEAHALAWAVERSGSADAALLVPWLIDTAVLSTTALLVSILGGLCWFLLLLKAEGVERAHRRTDALIRPSLPFGGKGAVS